MPPKPAVTTAATVRETTMGAYLTGYTAKILSDVDRYGVEHRSMVGMTPLMMATDVGNVPLVETLLERGARIDATDTLGRMPVHFALRRALTDPAYARDHLGSLFPLLCPTALEIEVDGRRLRLGRNQGELMVLLVLVARFHALYRNPQRHGGFTAKLMSEDALAAFPRSVIPDERRRRTYWNAMLARGEVESAYRPARKLWRRERQGHYVPSTVAVRVAGEGTEPGTFVPLPELLGLGMLEPRLVKAGG